MLYFIAQIFFEGSCPANLGFVLRNNLFLNLLIVERNHSLHIGCNLFFGESRHPSITIGSNAYCVCRKHTLCLCIKLLFGSEGQEGIEESIALVDPVVLLVGRDECPV